MVWTSAKKHFNCFLLLHKNTSQCKILIVPEEGWFGHQPKYSTPSKNNSMLCRFLSLHSPFYFTQHFFFLVRPSSFFFPFERRLTIPEIRVFKKQRVMKKAMTHNFKNLSLQSKKQTVFCAGRSVCSFGGGSLLILSFLHCCYAL